MATRDIDPKAFFTDSDAVAVIVSPDHLFGMLSRSFKLPSDQTALVRRERGDRVAIPPGGELTDNATEILLVRTSSFTLTYDSLGVSSLDQYDCSVSVTLRAAIVSDASELASFQKNVMGTSPTATTTALADYFRHHVQAAAALAAEGRGVQVLIDAKTNVVMADEIANQLKSCAFTAGLKIERPVLVRFDCAVYRQVRRSRADAERRREEFAATERIRKAAETAQERHAEHLTELLQRLQEQAGRDPDVTMTDLLKTFPETDRGELYAAIFATAGDHADTRSIVVGSGSELLWYDPQALDTPTRRYTLPDMVGALRSVQTDLDPAGARRLLIGAASGVHELAPEANESPTTYRTGTDQETRGGVNAVTFAGERIIASHSELGLLAWQRGEDQPAERLFRDRTEDVTAVRGVRFSDGHLFFSIDNVVYRAGPQLDAGELAVFTGSTAVITAVCPTRDGVYAGNANGELLHWSTDAPAEPKLLSASRQRAAESVVMLDLGGMERLFYTDTSLAVFARVVGDSFICRYEAGGQTIRRVEVAPDLIVATNDVRDRIICWAPGEPLKPYGVATVSRLTTHSIQDVCLIPLV